MVTPNFPKLDVDCEKLIDTTLKECNKTKPFRIGRID